MYTKHCKINKPVCNTLNVVHYILNLRTICTAIYVISRIIGTDNIQFLYSQNCTDYLLMLYMIIYNIDILFI